MLRYTYVCALLSRPVIVVAVAVAVTSWSAGPPALPIACTESRQDSRCSPPNAVRRSQMASTYALPIAPATNTHSHGRTRSQYAPEATPHANEAMNGSSPARSNGAHRHSHSEMNGHGQLHGAVRSPYAEYNGTAHEHDHGHAHSHSHSHSHSQSNDSAYTIKPFMNGRSNGGTRGELGFGQSPQRKGASAKRYGFSPIQETVAHPPPAVSS